jgi:uncharacterized membrane protein YgdD (TMEM256/DUF423 family)
MKNSKSILIIAALLGALAVIIGAFGAHGLKAYLHEHNHAETFETANKYLFYHVFLLIILGIRIDNKWHSYAALLTLLGIFFFCVSLYLICATHIKIFGAIAPIGGTAWVLAWLCFFWAEKNKLN